MLIDDLLSLETEELLNFRFNEHNFLIWPFIRRVVLEKIYLKLTNSSFPVAYVGKIGLKKSVLYIYNALKYNPYKWSNFPIVFFTTQRIVNLNKGGKYHNKIFDYFALEFPKDSLIVERTEMQTFKLPRFFDNVTFEDYIYIKGYARAIFKRLPVNEINKINTFIEYIKKKFCLYLDKKDINSIYKKLLWHFKVYPIIYKSYMLLFKNLRPSVIISVGRGSKRIYLYKVAKDLGIKVAEFQHGILNNSHLLYNFGESIINSSEYREYLPDYLLTFGDFWNSSIRDPLKKITIGNPHLSIKMKELENTSNLNKKQSKKVILIVSQGTHTNIFVNIAEYLSNKLSDDYIINFKLHPGEISFTERYNKLYQYNKIKVFKEGDIYDFISKSDCIIACYSTVILEAIAFNKLIFIYDDYWSKEFIPEEIGYRFKDNSELYSLITSKKIAVKNNPLFFWDTNWKENYRNFIENEIGLKI